MSAQERVDRYVESVDHPVSKAYFQAVFDVLLALKPEIKELDGYACMRMLQLTTIYLKDGRVINDFSDFSVMGTVSNLGEAIAVIFAPIESRAMRWASGYPGRMADPEVVSTADEYSARLKTLSIVDRISTE